jgi:endonuclease G
MKIVSRCAMGLLLIALGVMVVEFAIFLKRSEGAWWTLGLGALFTYLALLLGLVFRGPGNAMSRAAEFVFDFLLRHRTVTITAALVTTIAASLAGLQVYRSRDPPDGMFRVFAYSGANLPENRIKDLTIIFEVQAPAAHKRVATFRTSADGIAEFPAHEGDLLTVRVEDEAHRFYVIESKSMKMEDFAAARPFDMASVPASEWRSATPDAPLGAKISWRIVDASYFRLPSQVTPDNYGSSEAAEAFSALLGLPGAEALIRRDAYVAGFSPTLHQARWVAYEIKELGENVRRESRFRPDPLIPADAQARDTDFKGSGFDRGRLVPYNDVATSQDIARESNYSSTLVPMTGSLNRSVYLRLRRYTAQLKRPGAGNRVFVIRGPAYIDQGGADAHRFLAIGAGKIPVPTHIFQIVAVLEGGRLNLECFLVPNLKSYDGEPGQGMPPNERYRTPREAIERATGLRFFSGIDVTETGCR